MKHFVNLYSRLTKMQRDVENNHADLKKCNNLLFDKYFKYYPVKMIMPSVRPNWNKESLIKVLKRIRHSINMINGIA